MRTTIATPEATAALAQRYPQLPFNDIADLGIKASPIGFGSYRVDQSFPEHRAALEMALCSGINLVDTSANYTGGGSELLIGSVVGDLEESGALSRAEIVIISKVGYIQGREYRLSQNLKRDGRSYPEIVELGFGLEHCIHPEFIQDQLTRSLSRINCGSLDIYLLHNPEYFLSWAQRQNWQREKAHEEYYRRIKQAFEYLETEVNRGRIRCYGISSNTFPVPADEYEFTLLEQVLTVADEISPLHHFKAIQLPFNLLEHGCVTNRSQPGKISTLELAQRHRLAVFANRPLNAIYKGDLVRLSEENPDAEQMRHLIETVEAEWASTRTLSRMAVRALRSTDGISSVLVGMRQPSYVSEMLEELRDPITVADRTDSWLRLKKLLETAA